VPFNVLLGELNRADFKSDEHLLIPLFRLSGGAMATRTHMMGRRFLSWFPARPDRHVSAGSC